MLRKSKQKSINLLIDRIRKCLNRGIPRQNNGQFLEVFRRDRKGPAQYFERNQFQQKFETVLNSGSHLLVYGPPGQGKTTTLRHHLMGINYCVIECQRGIKKIDIYRIFLSYCGFSITVERKKRKGSQVNAVLKSVAYSLGATKNEESETTTQELSIDISNASDIVRVVEKHKFKNLLILNNFHLLSIETRQKLVHDLAVFYDFSKLQVILVSNIGDEYQLEKLYGGISGRLEKIYVGYWNNDEIRNYINQYSLAFSVSFPPLIVDSICDHCQGDINIVNQLCLLYLKPVSYQVNQDNSLAVKDDFNIKAIEYIASSLKSKYILDLSRLALEENLAVGYKVLVKKIQLVDVLNDQGQYIVENGRTVKQKEEYEEEDYFYTFLGGWLIVYLLRKFSQNNEKSVSIDDVIRSFIEEKLLAATHINQRRLKKIILTLEKSQNDLFIYPEIFSVDEQFNAIRIGDKNFDLLVKFIGIDEITEVISDQIEETPLNDVRRRNQLWRD